MAYQALPQTQASQLPSLPCLSTRGEGLLRSRALLFFGSWFLRLGGEGVGLKSHPRAVART